jgi:DNA repair exonuclease SbcCD ATPase subunit
VYKAVSESEVRIIAAVHDSTQPLRAASDDHELRLRRLEMDGCKAGQDAQRSAAAIGIKLDALTVLVSANTNARRGMLDTLSAGQRTILFIATAVGLFAVLMDIFSKYF